MTLYEIDRQLEDMIANAIDMETGEIIFTDEDIEALQMERDRKIENIALYVKNQEAMASALREEEKNLASRRRSCESKAERLKEYLKHALNGERFTTVKCDIKFRRSNSLEVSPEFIEWAQKNREDLLRYKLPEVDKSAVTKALKDEEIPFVGLVEKIGVTIK